MEKGQIPKTTAVLMMTVAGFFDVVNAFANAGVVLSSFVTVFAYLTFWVWFKIHGVNFTKDPKKLLRFGGTALIELIPVLNILPAITLGIILTIGATKLDKIAGIVPGGKQVASAVTNKTTPIKK